VATFSGVQLLALGMMGEYLARMHSRIMGQPAYVVRDTIAGASGIEGAAGGAARPESP
jgi:undecaprenyl-phosphate 4-deoxy-4-formamido-L-arabinose transferase